MHSRGTLTGLRNGLSEISKSSEREVQSPTSGEEQPKETVHTGVCPVGKWFAEKDMGILLDLESSNVPLLQ